MFLVVFVARLYSYSGRAPLTESRGQVTLAIFFDTGGAPPIYQTVDTVLASVLGYLRWIAGIQITPIAVSLAHPKPHESDGLEAFFGCPVAYGQPEDMIIFARADLDRPILVADEELRTEEHKSELQSQMRKSNAVCCLKKKNLRQQYNT